MENSKISNNTSSKEKLVQQNNAEQLNHIQSLFERFEFKINQVAEQISKIPPDSVVNPSEIWLKKFGL